MAVIAPSHYFWWLVSRASGIVALGLISISVLLGLTMATKILRRYRLGRSLAKFHEHVALVGMAAIAVHGLSLLGDKWLNPGVGGILVPFAMGYRPLFTGLGIIAGYLAALLGLSFYVRRTIGPRLWRKLHRATTLVWLLGVIHTLGAGTDASTPWLQAIMLATGVPILLLATLRVLQSRRAGAIGSVPRHQLRDGLPAPTDRAQVRGRSGAQSQGSGAQSPRKHTPAPRRQPRPSRLSTPPPPTLPHLNGGWHASRDIPDHGTRRRPRSSVAPESSS